MNIINQASQVFVFEDINDIESGKIGVLKLFAKLNEHKTPDTQEMHAIRKEFIKKVFTGYIKQIPVKNNAKYDVDMKDDNQYNSSGLENQEDQFNINTIGDRKQFKELVLKRIDDMDAMLVFRMYHSLSKELKQ